jgi:hypothetical protein
MPISHHLEGIDRQFEANPDKKVSEPTISKLDIQET